MNIWGYIVGSIIILFSIIVIAVILLQEGRQSNINAISGSTESFMDKSRGRTLDALLARLTKIMAAVFFVLVLVGMIVTKFL